MTDETKIIKGSGGAPKPPPPPYRAPDTLHSRQFATVQDLISEGEIEGFATASKAELTKGSTEYENASLKDVFLDNTPILKQSASNSNPLDTDFNFQNVTFKSKFGTSNQLPMSGIPSDTRTPTAVNVTVTNTTPVTRQVAASSPTSANADAIIITLTWPQIQVAEDDGDIRGDTVEYKIQVQYNSGGFTDIISTSVSGRTADAYSRDHRIDIQGDFPVDVRVVRVTPDSTESNRVNSFQFTSLQEVVDDIQRYPNSAYMALRLDSKQFNRIPNRKYRIRGIKVRIPGAGALNSGTPDVDPLTGRIRYPNGYIFNGTMGAAVYTNCPAMCLLDLLTNSRYGFGDHISDNSLDLFSFVAASKYANEEVDDKTGAGTKEARFSCNVNIQSPKEAFDAINELCGVMMCMPIWSSGTVSISQDKPLSPSYLFNLSNVSEGGFSYSGSSLKQRHSIFSVSYFNMESQEIDFEVVGDSDSAEDVLRRQKLGNSIKKVKAFACTSRGQAARLGRAMMFAEERQSEVITFQTSIDAGVLVRPGAVIEVNDPVRAGSRRGGRVVSATTTTITIDSVTDTDLPNLNENPTISVILSDGTIEIGSISNITSSVITVNSVTKRDNEGNITNQSAFSSAPNNNSPYLISSTSLQTQLFRVIQVEEKDGINYDISAITYIEDKYDFIENNGQLSPRIISTLNAPVLSPSNLGVTEKTIVINNIARSKLIVNWQAVKGVTQYLVNYRFEENNYVSVVVFSTDFELLDTKKGKYTIEVFSYNVALQLSVSPTTTTFTAVGKTSLPETITGLTLEPINEQFVRLRFAQTTAIDVLHGGRVYVRHTQLSGSSATFQSAQDIIEAVPGNSTEVLAPALAGTYLLKFQDDGGRFSETAASVTLSLVDILDSITVKTDREDNDTPPFNNTTSSLFSNTEYSSSKGGLILTNPSTNATGTYNFANTLDLGGVFSLTLKRHFQGVGFYVGDEFDNRTELIDTWTDFDGTVANDANAKIAVRTSTDMSSYSDFNDFANGTFKGRGFQFRITLTTADVAQNINLQQAGYVATMPSRTEQSSVIASGTSAKVVTFNAPFFVGTSALGNLNNFLPSINISPQNMATGDFFELSNISGTGFTVHFKNSSNASIDRNFTYSAVGFGKGG